MTSPPPPAPVRRPMLLVLLGVLVGVLAVALLARRERGGPVAPALLGTWHSRGTYEGRRVVATFVVEPGRYRTLTEVRDSGSWSAVDSSWRMVSAGGGVVEGEYRIAGNAVEIDGPDGLERWEPLPAAAADSAARAAGRLQGEFRLAAVRDGVPAVLRLAIEPGRYRLVTTSTDAGTLRAEDSTWTTVSRYGDLVTSGVYHLLGADTLSLTGPAGTAIWTRR